MSPGVVPEMDLAGGYSGYSMGAAVAVLAAGALVAGARSLVARKLVVISRISQDQNLEWYGFCYVCYFFYFCYFCSLSLTLQETKESLACHQVQLLASKGRLCRPGVLERCGWLGTCHSWVVCLKIMELRFAIIGQSRSRKKGLLIRSEMENLWRFKWILPQDMQFWTKSVSHKLYKQFCGLSLILSPSLLSLVLSLVGICPVPVAGYLPDGTPMNRAGNAVNHPETIGPDPHTPGSPLPRAEFVNSIGYLPDGTAMNAAGLEGFEWWIASGREWRQDWIDGCENLQKLLPNARGIAFRLFASALGLPWVSPIGTEQFTTFRHLPRRIPIASEIQWVSARQCLEPSGDHAAGLAHSWFPVANILLLCRRGWLVCEGPWDETARGAPKSSVP